MRQKVNSFWFSWNKHTANHPYMFKNSAITITTTTSVGGRQLGNTLNQGKQPFCTHRLGKGIRYEVFGHFRLPILDFCFLAFFHTGQVHQLNHWALRETLPSMMAPRFATFTKALLIIEGGIFTSCFLILLSIIQAFLLNDLCACDCMECTLIPSSLWKKKNSRSWLRPPKRPNSYYQISFPQQYYVCFSRDWARCCAALGAKKSFFNSLIITHSHTHFIHHQRWRSVTAVWFFVFFMGILKSVRIAFLATGLDAVHRLEKKIHVTRSMDLLVFIWTWNSWGVSLGWEIEPSLSFPCGLSTWRPKLSSGNSRYSLLCVCTPSIQTMETSVHGHTDAVHHW